MSDKPISPGRRIALHPAAKKKRENFEENPKENKNKRSDSRNRGFYPFQTKKFSSLSNI